MELPSRTKGDILLPSGEMTAIRQRLRRLAAQNDLATVIACAFDHRTRILPFIFADLRMAPAGVRAMGSALVDSGFPKTRIVLQQWNKNFQPSEMRLDGRIPDMFLVSSMHLHSASCDWLISQALKIDPARRPLIIAGGPRVIYAPWEVLSAAPHKPDGADVAVTGEEYVFLQLLEVLLTLRAGNEPLLSTFQRARDCGALDEIPGLVYGRSSTLGGPNEELVDTGIQRLVGDLDELPHASLGYRLLEPSSRGATLGPKALPANRVRSHSLISSIVLTIGCKFRCAYCPIPAYNQRTHRVKSGERIADEIGRISEEYNIINFFGADDNFFNDAKRTVEVVEPLARGAATGKRPFCKIRWGTEATVHDTIRMREHLPLMRQAGLRAMWMGVEDLTAKLVNKGQSESKTLEAFRLLRESGIAPIPMLMHHDEQPLISRTGNYGLINQLRTLRKAGAMYMQVMMLTPAPGSKWFGDTYTSGLAFDRLSGEKIEPYMVDGNYVVASRHPRPWLKQFNLLASYTYFFNPIRMLASLVFTKSKIPFADAETRPLDEVASYPFLKRLRRRLFLKIRAQVTDAALQGLAMVGLYYTYRRTLGWAWRLFRGQVERSSQPPRSLIPMRSVDGGGASHALPGTPTELVLLMPFGSPQPSAEPAPNLVPLTLPQRKAA